MKIEKKMKKWEGSNGFEKTIKCFYLRIVGHRKSFEKLFYYISFYYQITITFGQCIE